MIAEHEPVFEVITGNVYLYPPTIPEGQTMTEYRLSKPRKRTRWQRLVRRLNGHG